MKQKLTSKQMIAIATMLFGMFFGAGNLIFPVHMGQIAGANMVPAIIGFIVTGVTLPLLGVAAIGITKSEGLQDLSSKVGKGYSYFFTIALYLTIGPFFAIPRCCTVSYTVGIAPIVGDSPLPLFIFSAVFFIMVLFFALRPSKILTYIGKILTPIFLIILGAMIVVCFINPMGSVATAAVDSAYQSDAFFNGFLEGYNTMDALAALAFGIIVVEVIRKEGVTEPNSVAGSTVKAGIFSCIFMALIYTLTTVMGAMSTGTIATSDNGGTALYEIATVQFGKAGAIVLAIMISVACLKTAVALVQSCSETFIALFPNGPKYTVWAVVFTLIAFGLANVGLTAIIGYSIPVLMFLYPLAITLILLSLFGRFFNYDKKVYISVTVFALLAAIFDLVHSLPEGLYNVVGGSSLDAFGTKFLPFYSIGLGWIIPSIVGLVIGLILHISLKNKTN